VSPPVDADGIVSADAKVEASLALEREARERQDHDVCGGQWVYGLLIRENGALGYG
jgi:hypothetical protein